MAQSLATNLSAYLMPCAGEFFQVRPQEYGLLSSVMYTASYIAAPIFGLLADGIGRMPATLLSVSIILTGGVGTAVAPSFSALLAWQAVLGLGLGGTMAPFSLLAELSPPSVRGSILNATNFFWAFGTCIVCGAAWCTLGGVLTFPDSGWWPGGWFWGEPWRVLTAACCVPVLLSLLLGPTIVESPHWLVEQGQHKRAMHVLARMAWLNGRRHVGEEGSGKVQGRFSGRRHVGEGGEDEGGEDEGVGRLHEALLAASPSERAFGSGLYGSSAACGVSGSGAGGSSAGGSAGGSGALGSWLAVGRRPSEISEEEAEEEAALGGSLGGSARHALPTSSPCGERSARSRLELPSGLAHRVCRCISAALGLGGVADLLHDRELRVRTVLHWTQWLLAGFGWGGIIYYQTMALSPAAATTNQTTNATLGWEGVSGGMRAADPALRSESMCSFDYGGQLLVFAMELPGTSAGTLTSWLGEWTCPSAPSQVLCSCSSWLTPRADREGCSAGGAAAPRSVTRLPRSPALRWPSAPRSATRGCWSPPPSRAPRSPPPTPPCGSRRPRCTSAHTCTSPRSIDDGEHFSQVPHPRARRWRERGIPHERAGLRPGLALGLRRAASPRDRGGDRGGQPAYRAPLTRAARDSGQQSR